MPAKTFFEYVCPVKIVSGRKALANLPYELAQLGSKKPMIITDKGVVAAGLIAKVKAAMVEFEGGISVIFDETPVDSSDKICDKAADIFRKNGCDALVAVGGGSAIDTAKGVNIVVSENTDDLLKYQGVDRISVSLKPLIVIPTTAGTGSEVTNVAVIVNVAAQVKMALMSNKLFPNVAILDPAMTMSLPPKLTAGTGMDALTHSVEAIYSLQGNPVSSALAAAAIKLVKANVVAAVKDGNNVEARMGMADAALIAGMAFTNAMVGMNHALAHSCGAAAHIPHGVANAILLPYSMEYNIGKAAEKIAAIAPIISDDNLAGLDAKARAMKAVEGVRKLTSELNALCGMPIKLSEAGVKEDMLNHIADLAINDGALTYNPEEMDKNDALAVLKKAF
jgi:alcohol dehydrogenase